MTLLQLPLQAKMTQLQTLEMTPIIQVSPRHNIINSLHQHLNQLMELGKVKQLKFLCEMMNIFFTANLKEHFR